MRLTIDNLDYTSSLDSEHPLRVWRRLNRPTEFRAYLYASDAQFIVPAAGARLVLARESGQKAFTGYVDAAPQHEYLGWGERGPAYRYLLRAFSDESPLSAKTLPNRAEFVQRAAGDILKTLANDLAPGALDTSACEEVAVLPTYTADPRRRFDEHAAELSLRARASYRAHDGQLFFRPIGSATHTLDEASPNFSPNGLKLVAKPSVLNDVTVTGAVAPAAFVKDYLCGSGYQLSYSLSEMPFLRSGSVLLEEEYRGAQLRPEYWSVEDPTGAIAVSQGKLCVTGGTGTLGTTLLRFAEKMEPGGALSLDHGEFAFTGSADALVGGLYNGNFEMSGCVAGFRLTPSTEASTQIAAVVNGAVAGQSITTAAGRRYVLTTRIYAGEVFRHSQIFAGELSAIGGDAIASGARLLLQVHEIDPNNPASQVAPAIVLYEGWLPDVPACCSYALVNAATLNASVSYTRLTRAADAEVRTCTVWGNWRNRRAGALSEGAECRVSGTSLYFYPAYAPEEGERILVTYRVAARAISRMVDEAAIMAAANAGDDGHRAAVVSVQSPRPRTFDDCDHAALALLRTCAQPGWTGEYSAWNDCLDGDIFPADSLAVVAPSRDAQFAAIVREVEIETTDLLDEHCRYTIKFATEGAEPVALRLEPAPELRIPEQATSVLTVGTEYLEAVSKAEIVDAGSTMVMIDAGIDPPANGAFEVRRSDTGWGLENDRNLAGRFENRVFTVPRTSRSQTWYVRQHDGAGRYSRVSTILHLDYPL